MRNLALKMAPWLAAGMFTFTAAAAVDAQAPAARVGQGAGVAGIVQGYDHRPEGMTPTTYDLEAYDTSVGTTPVVRGDPATFELFGFKLGMSIREADRNARLRHLRFNGGNLTGPSFEGRVAIRAASLLGRNAQTIPRVLERTSMKDAEGNSYMLVFLPMEAGATLVSIAYRGSFEGNTAAQYMAALQERFGKPTHGGGASVGLTARWCSKGDLVLAWCEDRPALALTTLSEINLALNQGERARTDLERRIEAKAAAVAGMERKRPSF